MAQLIGIATVSMLIQSITKQSTTPKELDENLTAQFQAVVEHLEKLSHTINAANKAATKTEEALAEYGQSGAD